MSVGGGSVTRIPDPLRDIGRLASLSSDTEGNRERHAHPQSPRVPRLDTTSAIKDDEDKMLKLVLKYSTPHPISLDSRNC